MAFLNANRRFRTAAEVSAYLAPLLRPMWVTGSVYHNTYRPTEAQWQGHASMSSMQRTYQGYTPAWDRGPHFFVAAHTRADGYWMMTPPQAPGIHAGPCNRTHWGIEVVGDFQRREMSPLQVAMLVDLLEVLHRWANVPARVDDHRTCMPDRTCPGNAAHAQLDYIQRSLARRLAPKPPPLMHFVIRAGIDYASVRQGPATTYPQAGEMWPGDSLIADTVIEGQIIGGEKRWIHRADGLGFVHYSLVEK